MIPEGTTGSRADAILGTVPSAVYSPRTIEEARQILEATGRENLSISFIGGGTEIELGGPPKRLDALLRTTGFSKIVEYAPSDMIVTVEAGATLAALAEVLRQHRQQLALDPPRPDRATVGGIIAANSFGPRRGRFGSVRDLIIGVSIIRADGTLARGGGKVVKNVAGFDIPKLICGSLGTLGLIASATFRLHPLPEVERSMLAPACTAAQVRALVARLIAAQLEPTSVVAFSSEKDFDVVVRFEGFGAGVAQQCERFAADQRAAGRPSEALDEKAAESLWARHDDARTAGELRVKIAALPSQIEALSSNLQLVLGTLRDPSFLWYATLGLGFISGTSESAPSTCRALEDLGGQLEGLQGSLVLQAAPQAIREKIEWCKPPASLSLMRRLKHRMDPQERLNPGRFVGGI